MLFIRKLHKWLGLIVGLQLLLWTVSGLVFAWLDHHEVTAEHSVRSVQSFPIASNIAISEPSTWLRGDQANIYEIRLMPLLDTWVWRIESDNGIELRGAADGTPVTVNDAQVKRLALSTYAGEGELASIQLQPTPGVETRDSGPVWQAQFNDASRTTLYFSADDGRLVEARNDTWRLFDFFWMLHTMDYKGRDNFNNPIVITVGTAALWLSVSGFILLFRSFRKRDFEFLAATRPRSDLS